VGNARLAEWPAVPAVAHELFEPGFVMRMPSPRKPGLKLDGGVSTLPGRAAVERRQASCPLPFPPPLAGEDMEGGSGRASCTAGWTKRLSAFRFPFFLTRGHCERSEAIQFGAVAVSASETSSASPRWIASSLRSSQ
jgi:hypothetical protein